MKAGSYDDDELPTLLRLIRVYTRNTVVSSKIGEKMSIFSRRNTLYKLEHLQLVHQLRKIQLTSWRCA